MPAAKKKLDDEQPELPRQAQVGDRIRLKPEQITEYTEAAKKVGWDFDPYRIVVVTREDKYNPGGGRRLFFEGIPFCYSANDVVLAWNTEGERREMLRSKGWRV